MLLSIANLVLDILWALIIIRIVISWIMPINTRGNEFVNFIYQITEPIMAPFRFILPIGKMGGLDLSPIVILFLISMLRSFLAVIL